MRWAACNLGASNPWEYGGYYQWAGTEDVSDVSKLLGRENTHWSGSGARDDKTVLDPTDDAASVQLGEVWRMPTEDEWKELLDNSSMPSSSMSSGVTVM